MKRPVGTDPHHRIDVPDDRLIPRMTARAKKHLARAMGITAARLLRPAALLDPSVRSALWRAGLAVQAKGFYSSIVDPLDVPARPTCSEYPGVDLNVAVQLRYLAEVFPRFSDEYTQLLEDQPSDWAVNPRFFLSNDAFNGADALAYWAMIRCHRPATIMEIGSGHSTLLAAQAVRMNGYGHVRAIDPFPRAFVGREDGIALIRKEVQEVAVDEFTALKANDVLFIDGSHIVRVNGDTNFVVLEILPRLAAGVLVHVHDVHFPFDYPTALLTDRNVYWTEQYLLHAYLIGNRSVEVVFGTPFCLHYFPEQTRQAFAPVRRLGGASLWLRTKG